MLILKSFLTIETSQSRLSNVANEILILLSWSKKELPLK